MKKQTKSATGRSRARTARSKVAGKSKTLTISVSSKRKTSSNKDATWKSKALPKNMPITGPETTKTQNPKRSPSTKTQGRGEERIKAEPVVRNLPLAQSDATRPRRSEVKIRRRPKGDGSSRYETHMEAIYFICCKSRTTQHERRQSLYSMKKLRKLETSATHRFCHQTTLTKILKSMDSQSV